MNLKANRLLVIAAALLCSGVALAQPGPGLANDDNDNSDSRPERAEPGTSQQTIVPAGDTPDLKLEYVGFYSPANDQLITLKVTNVGKSPSAKSVVRVVTSRPEPTPWFRELDVRALAPGESEEIYYPLAASCKGHLIRALVDAPQDSDSANDAVEAEVCTDLASLPPILVVNPPVVAAHLRPGPHVEIFTTVEGAVFGKARENGLPLAPLPYPRTGELETGFYNGATTNTNYIWRSGFRFDVSLLREARSAGWVPTEAALTFQEIPYPHFQDGLAFHMQLGNADIVPTRTCAVRLAVPTVQWSGGPDRGLIPNDVIREAGAIGAWNVYDQMLEMVVDPDRERRGFLILGHSESMDDNYAACRSRIKDVKLTVSYTIP